MLKTYKKARERLIVMNLATVTLKELSGRLLPHVWER